MKSKIVSLSVAAGLALGCAVAFGPAAAFALAPPGDTSPLVAEWSGGGVTVNEMLKWWSYGSPSERKAVNTYAEKEEFLNSLINATLMIEKAESLGITQLPTVADFYHGREIGSTNEKVLTLATEGRITVKDADVEDIYRKRTTQWVLRQIMVSKLDLARALEDSIKAGVPFEDLAVRYSTAPTGEHGGMIGKVRWGDFTDVFSAQAMRLETGQVSQPFQLGGAWCILKMDSKVQQEPKDPAAERKTIRARLARDAALRERSAYLDSLKTAYDFKIDINAVVDLSAKYTLAIEKTGERAAVLGEDVVPELSDAERKVPVVTYKGGTITEGEAADMVARTPFEVRPRVDDVEDLEPFIRGKATDSLVFAEGRKRGIDKLPEIVSMVEKAKRRKTVFAFYDFVSRNIKVSEDDIAAEYAASKQNYKMNPGWMVSKIVVGTKEAADSVLARLDKGESFEAIARIRSRDPFTATDGGDAGFLQVGQDTEFDGFLETMKPGERKAFRSLEGFVVLWLRSKQEPGPATLADAHDEIERNLREARKEEVLAKWIADRRALVGVKINADVLQGVVLK